MTCSQLAEWQAYEMLEPFGEYRSELRHGQSMAMTANINRDRKAQPEPFKPVEFMNFTERPEEKKLTAKEVNDIFKGFFGTNG